MKYLLYPWQTRAIRDLIFKELDRSGVLEIGDSNPDEAVSVAIGIPLEVVTEGLPPLFKDGTLVHNGSSIFCPNFLEAQEAKQSDKERQRKSRELRRDTEKAKLLSSVTECDGSVTICDDTVTRGHMESHAVTPSQLSQLSLTNSPDFSKSVSAQILELEKRYSLEKELLTEIRNSCALSRKNGKMADSVWLNTLRRIEKYPIEAVLDAGSEYVEKYADGSRSEAYFVAVVAGKAKNGAKSVASGTKRTDLVNAKEMLKRIEKGMYPAHEVEDMKRTGEIARWEKIVSESEQ